LYTCYNLSNSAGAISLVGRVQPRKLINFIAAINLALGVRLGVSGSTLSILHGPTDALASWHLDSEA
jgi:hypothetical protein